jgi:hypothetical protein
MAEQATPIRLQLLGHQARSQLHHPSHLQVVLHHVDYWRQLQHLALGLAEEAAQVGLALQVQDLQQALDLVVEALEDEVGVVLVVVAGLVGVCVVCGGPAEVERLQAVQAIKRSSCQVWLCPVTHCSPPQPCCACP